MVKKSEVPVTDETSSINTTACEIEDIIVAEMQHHNSTNINITQHIDNNEEPENQQEDEQISFIQSFPRWATKRVAVSVLIEGTLGILDLTIDASHSHAEGTFHFKGILFFRFYWIIIGIVFDTRNLNYLIQK